MQITLNKVAFDVRAVPAALRTALLDDPGIARGRRRDVWSWDRAAGQGSYLVGLTDKKGVPLPPGLSVFVPRPGPNGGTPHRADGPTTKMAERLLAAVGAKGFVPLLQALARVTAVPQKTVPFDAFAALNPLASYTVQMETEFAIVELGNPARNLAFYAFVPGLVAFSHRIDGAADEGAPAAGSIRPGFVLPPPNRAALAMRRLAVATRLTELQAELGERRPADLAPDDPRRDQAARLGAEWRVLSPKAKAA